MEARPSEVPTRPTARELVLAWAKDIETGEPRYIGELREDQTGQKCGCQCYSCNLPLEAVNAGKSAYKIRPHFRHPDGAPKADCMVLSARAAALELLIKDGQVTLPRRRRSVEVAVLSGNYHQAWVEHPRELVRIVSAEFEDRVTAIITLDDGRQFKIGMVGSMEASDDPLAEATAIPTIRLYVDDPAIADMAPDELRKRVTAIVDDGQWCSHWDDATLAQQAEEAARQQAIDALDWADLQDDIPADLSGLLRRESLLHLKAKEILEKERRIFLPDLCVRAEGFLPNGRVIQERSMLGGQVVRLDSVALEKTMGQIRPDVCANTIEDGPWPAQPLLIEITVSNTISRERLERIQAKNIATLEIDISRMGGTVTFEEFRRLIVDECAGKRWLHHPWMAEEQSRLDQVVQAQVDAAVILEQQRIAEEEAKQVLLSVPLDDLGKRYLDAVLAYGWYRAHSDDLPESGRIDMANALDKVQSAAQALAARGFPEATDRFLFVDQGNILDRLLSIKLDKAVGYRIDTAWQVINAIMQERPPFIAWHSLYLAAIKVYQPTLTGFQSTKVETWRGRVLDSLKAGKNEYRRSPKYDRLVSLLFPEMASILTIPLPGATAAHKQADASKTGTEEGGFHWREKPGTPPSPSPHFVDSHTQRIIDFARRFRDRGFEPDQAIVECSIRHQMTWDAIVDTWRQAGIIEGQVDLASWKRANPKDAKWLYEE